MGQLKFKALMFMGSLFKSLLSINQILRILRCEC